MYYVYILRSKSLDKLYVGLTEDLQKRLSDHNSGKSAHTSKYKPWIVVSYAAFVGRHKAADFEKYLKTGSGRAFIKKRLN